MINIDTYKSLIINAIDNIDMVSLLSAVDVIRDGDNIYICGNGGAATASIHMANDLQKMGNKNAISLASNISLVTAWANDEDYKKIFTRQLEKLYDREKKNVLILLSGSGTSKNIVDVGKFAINNNFNVILITGNPYNGLRNHPVNIICLDSIMQVTEDMFMIINHMIALELYNE